MKTPNQRRRSFLYRQREIAALASLAVATTAVLFIGVFARRYVDAQTELRRLHEERANIASLAQALDEVEAQYERVRALLGADALEPLAPGPQRGREVAALAAHGVRLDRIETELSELRTALAADPSNAISLAGMRRDLTAAVQKQADDIASVRREIERTVTMITWFLGFVGAVSLTIFGGIVARIGTRVSQRT